MDTIHAWMITHPHRTPALLIADAVAAVICIAVAFWAHFTDHPAQ